MASSIMKWVLFLAVLQVFRSSSGAFIPTFTKGLVTRFPRSTVAEGLRTESSFSKEINRETLDHSNPKDFLNPNPNNQNILPPLNPNPNNQNILPTFNYQNPKKIFYNQHPTTILEKSLKYKANEFGVNLAKQYFGDEFIKGFRWGRKLNKRVLSVAKKCNKMMKAFKLLCPQPVQISTLTNSAIEHCIVEVTSSEYDPTLCLPWYESDENPPEATCDLDRPDTLVSMNCTN